MRFVTSDDFYSAGLIIFSHTMLDQLLLIQLLFLIN